MEFEWDAAKRRKTIAVHGIVFLDAALLFDGRDLLSVPSPRAGEDRWLSVGELEGRLIAVAWTWRDGRIRIATARRARDEEKIRYRAAFGG